MFHHAFARAAVPAAALAEDQQVVEAAGHLATRLVHCADDRAAGACHRAQQVDHLLVVSVRSQLFSFFMARV